MSKQLTNFLAVLLLTFMFSLAILSMAGDSLTMDEVAHLPAGYSYLTQKDMRLNPEHPPLMKDLAAFPLLFIKNIKFPSEIPAWKDDINGQWAFGYHFLYHMGNPADKMIFWARIPMILLLILLGFFIFKWARELFGNKVALLALFFFSFSPTFLAHGRLVTTDVAASFGFFIGIYYFLRALENPTKKNIIFGGLAFGIAQLLKFSVILLVPLFIFLALIWWWVNKESHKNKKNFLQPLKILALIFLIGFLLVWSFYIYHIWGYLPERQVRDTKFLLSSFGFRPAADFVIFLADKPILRAFGQYLLGLLMVFQRAAGGHTTYFLGEVGAAGWKHYFPIVYAIKIPLAFHILTIVALCFAAFEIKKPFFQRTFFRLKNWTKNNFPEVACLSFIALYWAVSLRSNLNIGVRHLLPAFPFTMLLVAREIGKLTANLKKFLIVLLLLLIWQAISVISIYPHFLAYFNELVAPNQGYLYTVNSNLDWGQDLRRLNDWVEKNNIEKIYVDYFGGGDAKYYLKEKFAPWWGTRSPDEFPKGNYLAVSVTFLQGGRGLPIAGFDQPTGYYLWLYQYEPPIAKIGYSIFIYHIK